MKTIAPVEPKRSARKFGAEKLVPAAREDAADFDAAIRRIVKPKARQA